MIFVFLPHQIDTFVNPLKSSMRNVSQAVKGLPDSLAEGMTKVSDNMGRMSERLGQDLKQSILKVTQPHGASTVQLSRGSKVMNWLFCFFFLFDIVQ